MKSEEIIVTGEFLGTETCDTPCPTSPSKVVERPKRKVKNSVAKMKRKKKLPKKTEENKKEKKNSEDLNVRRVEIKKLIQELKGETNDGDRCFCKECKKFIRQPYFFNHVKFIHFKVRDHLCPTCGYGAHSHFLLQQHTAAMHGKGSQAFPCEFCDRSYGTDRRLTRHVREVHAPQELKMQNQVICQFCGLNFSKTSLKEHLRIHTGALPYSCRFCSRKFRKKWTVKTHERQHTGLKPYKCSFPGCEEAFTQNVVRKSHEYRVHGNEEFKPQSKSLARKLSHSDVISRLSIVSDLVE